MTEEGSKTESESPKETPRQPMSIPGAIVIGVILCVTWGICGWFTHLLFSLLNPYIPQLHSAVMSDSNDDFDTFIVLIAYIATPLVMISPLFAGASITTNMLAGRR